MEPQNKIKIPKVKGNLAAERLTNFTDGRLVWRENLFSFRIDDKSSNFTSKIVQILAA